MTWRLTRLNWLAEWRQCPMHCGQWTGQLSWLVITALSTEPLLLKKQLQHMSHRQVDSFSGKKPKVLLMPWLYVKYNYYEIISVLYFRRNHVWNRNKSIHISAAEGLLKLFQNYFSDNERVGKYSRAAISPWNNFKIISGKFPRDEIKRFRTDMNKSWNNAEIFYFTCNRSINDATAWEQKLQQ